MSVSTLPIGFHLLSSKGFRSRRCKGQAVVEFTLVFMLLLVVSFIPADFGLAFFTGQLASNASREGARIAAAEPNLPAQVGNCVVPACYSLADGSILKETAKRISSALLPDAQITVSLDGAAVSTCNRQLAVAVTGNYNYFFLGLLNYFGAPVPSSAPISRMTQMRWEHQSSCF